MFRRFYARLAVWYETETKRPESSTQHGWGYLVTWLHGWSCCCPYCCRALFRWLAWIRRAIVKNFFTGLWPCRDLSCSWYFVRNIWDEPSSLKPSLCLYSNHTLHKVSFFFWLIAERRTIWFLLSAISCVFLLSLLLSVRVTMEEILGHRVQFVVMAVKYIELFFF